MEMHVRIFVFIGMFALVMLAASSDSLAQSQRVFKKSLPQKEIIDAGSNTYYITLPSGYETSNRDWPVLLFLHGGGGLIEGRRAIGPHRIAGELEHYPFIVVTPMVGRPRGWSNEFHLGVLNTLLDEVLANYRADSARVYVTGVSMGGSGTWALAIDSPDRFAAIAPVSYGSKKDQDLARIKDLPISIYHCVLDHKAPYRKSAESFAALEKLGADVTLTSYPLGGLDGNPHDGWARTYSNLAFYEWLLKHRKGPDGKIVREAFPPADANDEFGAIFAEFSRELFRGYRQHQGFTDIQGGPQAGTQFSLPIRNPFSEPMKVGVTWEGGLQNGWRITTTPSQTVVGPGEQVTIRFEAQMQRADRVFPRPTCRVVYSAGDETGQFEILLPMHIDGYLRANRPTLKALPVKASPNIDGKLTDETWQRPPDVVNFQSETLDVAPSVRTEAWLSYDASHLYVAMRCEEPQLIVPAGKAADRRDKSLWQGDSVEILLDTARDRKDMRYYYRIERALRRKNPDKLRTFYQFIIDPGGALLDTRIPDRKFDAGAKVATSQTETGWTVEIAIPFESLGMDAPTAESQIGIALCRKRLAREAKGDWPAAAEMNAQYPPLNGNNHRKEHYADMRFQP